MAQVGWLQLQVSVSDGMSSTADATFSCVTLPSTCGVFVVPWPYYWI